MGDGSDYPSPRSEAPNGATAASVLATLPDSLSTLARMNEQPPPLSYIDPARPRLSVRRSRDPPKNTEGQIYCDHPDCHVSPPTFRRPCEWNKHMDKHDRPYKCLEPGCDKIQGFTYSGGLLRHQREVHKKNTDAKKPLMCPYADCNRSTGNGFTRQENLREHLRRRHMHTDDSSAIVNVEMAWDRGTDLEGVRAATLPAAGLKRKNEASDGYTALPETDENGVDLHGEIKRLRREVQEKDRRLKELERIVSGLQQAMPPPPAEPESQPVPQSSVPQSSVPQSSVSQSLAAPVAPVLAPHV